MKRVLHIVGSLERNGIETFLMNVYRHIDRTVIQFDFAIYNEPSENSYGDEVKQLGGKIYIVPKKSNGWLKCYNALKRIIKDNNYDIVWRNTDSCIGGADLLAAKIAGARVRVLHAHSSNVFGYAKVLHYLLRPICNLATTKRIACGRSAAKWMFGNREFEFIPNGIDTQMYQYNENIRNEFRRNFSLENKFVIGFVGRLEEVKNPLFLIDVFKAFVCDHENSVLMVVGSGTLENECKRKVEEYNIADKVLFLGARKDVSMLLQAIDAFIMTSLYEGFPVALIEAQAAGLPCVLSDVISKETNLIERATYMSLNAPLDKWSNAIEMSMNRRVYNGNTLVSEKGYDIYAVTKAIMDFVNNT